MNKSECNDSMIFVQGERFTCPKCGASVFHKGDCGGIWICNGCMQEFADETYVPEPPTKKTVADTIRLLSNSELEIYLRYINNNKLPENYDWTGYLKTEI